jgi:hypothetical protein
VVLFASADASTERRASTVTRRAGEVDVMRDARDEVLAKLATEVVRQCEQHGGAQAPADAT